MVVMKVHQGLQYRQLLLYRNRNSLYFWYVTIPISFEYEGIQFDGTLEDALGGGSSFWLIINNYSYGQLVKQQPGNPGENLPPKWYFYPTKGMFEELAGYFGELVDHNSGI